MAATARVRLLGTFRLEVDGVTVTGLESPRVQSLLAYLLLHRQAPLTRQQIAFEFWPDSSEEQARTNLRQLLHYLRRDLPGSEKLLDVTAKTLRWHPEAPLSFDVSLFESEARRAERAPGSVTRRRHLTEALRHYGGELLPGRFEEWLLPIRERLSQSYLEVLEQLSELCEADGDEAEAIRHARRLLQHDPLHENGYLRLIGLYARTGDRARALHVYHRCVGVLRKELGVDPGPAVTELYRTLLAAGTDEPAMPAAAAGERLLGRETAWNALLDSWRAADSGTRFVWLTGEAGIGKSHLSETFQEWCGEQGGFVAAARCYGAGVELAYAPLIDWLRGDRLQGVLHGLDGGQLSEVARLLPELLASRPDVPHPEPLTEGWQRTRLFEGLSRVFAERQQLQVLALDDAQWCDGETLAWLRHLAGREAQARRLVLVALRSDELQPDHPLAQLLIELRGRSLVTEIELGPLSRAETEGLTNQLLGKVGDAEEVTRIYRESEGNPLFITELTRVGSSLPSQSNQPLSSGSLPPRMAAVLQARLAPLSARGRRVAQVASCLGRYFDYDLLAGAAQMSEDELVGGLDELWRRRIIREQGGDAYDFSHEKLRMAVYSEMRDSRRRLLHRRIATALESFVDEAPRSVAAAFHYEQAGLPAQAVGHLHAAAAAAQRIFGNQVAISLLERALRLISTLPEGDTRSEMELDTRVALGVSLVARRGYAAPEVVENYERALSLARQLGQRQDGPVLRALSIAHVVRGELEQARILGEELLDLGRQADDALVLVEARYVLGVTLFWQGALVPARQQLEQALLHYQPELRSRHIALFSQDPQVICLSRLAFVSFCLGQQEQARSHSERALRLAEELAHPFSTAYASIWAALLHSLRREPTAVALHAERAEQLCREHGIGLWGEMGTILQGWVRGESGDLPAGLELMGEGLSVLRETGAEFVRPYFLSLLAELRARAGEVEQGLALLTEAQAAIDSTGERWSEAELHRIRGELLGALPSPDFAGAEAAFERSLAIASAQEARAFESRTTESAGVRLQA